jgi:hypothetical protein
MHEESNKFRPIWDGRYINSYISVPGVKYETLRDISLMYEPSMQCIAFDLKSGYHAVSLAEECRKYFCFCVDGEYYSFNVLPFGLNVAPLIFVLLTRHLVQLLRTTKFGVRHGVHVLHYIDDFLVLLKKDQVRRYILHKIKNIILRLGLTLHPDKSDFNPCTSR